MKKFILPVIVILIIVSGITCFIFFGKSKNVDNVEKENVVEKSTNVNEEQSNTESTIIDESKDEDIIEQTQENKTETPEVKKEENKSDNSIKESNTKQNTTVVEEKKTEEKKTAWEELGISEYDYYHKPMWSWARIDYSIDEYKTESKTKEACESKGNEYFEQGLGYSCTSVVSYAGTYLGEMLKTF